MNFKKLSSIFLTALMVLALSGPGQAQVKLEVKEHVLTNGMKILMIPKPGVPRVVCHIYYKVGSINERPGTTGLAHIHEHMMFKGTRIMGVTDFEADNALNRQIDDLMNKIYREKYWKKDGDQAKIAEWQKQVDELIKAEKKYIIKDDLWETYMKNGGTGLNASTSSEVTGYYVTLPSNKVELQMLLESDRMMNAYFREFYSEKDVIMEERRLSENQPGFYFNEQVNAAFYAASPYHWEVIGWMDDLKKVNKDDLIEFHDQYYVPNNAIAIYVGDVKPEAIISLAEKYFGAIPKAPDVEPIRTGEPPQYSEKRMYGQGPGMPSFQLWFHIPPDGDPDVPALNLLSSILSGETGRLNKSLVKEKDLAIRAMAMSRPQWYAGAFTFSIIPKLQAAAKPEEVEKAIWEEIDKIKKDGVMPEELQKAKNKTEAAFIRSLESPMFLASRIGRAELNRGWRSLLTDLEDIKKVTSDDIKKVANKYFDKDNSLVAIYSRGQAR
ncbi:MAG TPA: pitrilysin family protein [Candidatus Saccharicenans sp.]|jgi:predicted Zn-dependent peptidase|nr:insulinase family protein [Candidatus Saccharicenans sp.]HRD01437.1 pitrilysin family protein [Candidatus Saccharicenans sp.]